MPRPTTIPSHSSLFGPTQISPPGSGSKNTKNFKFFLVEHSSLILVYSVAQVDTAVLIIFENPV